MESYFEQFRKNIIGIDKSYASPYGVLPIIYADWIASGRLYGPIEEKIQHEFGPFIGNTHTETSETGTLMTKAYHHAQSIIKKHVNANENDILLTTGFGMTGAIVKFQRLLGIKYCGHVYKRDCLKDAEKPIVFVTHMEHHSNQTSWLETASDVVVLEPGPDLLVNPDELRAQLKKYENRKMKIGSFTACSNVTGIEIPYHQLARIMHEHGGLCFIDFAAAAPYCEINMHPDDPMEKLDAIFFSPHKFLGGPGSSGVLIFDRKIYHNPAPDQPGGGTVDWTNPWGEYKFVDNIEAREDGGTPGFLQAIRTALAINLKEKMGVENICKREEELLEKAFEGLEKIPGLYILAHNQRKRIGAISFYFMDIHYNLVVKLLSDRFGIQMRGGCACAGTYGHYLLDVSYEQSRMITERINSGDLSLKPGWVRMSLHPTMTNHELETILYAIDQIAKHHHEWGRDYSYNKYTNEFYHISEGDHKDRIVAHWFDL